MTMLLEILKHALGRDEYGQRPPNTHEDYRNHYCVGSDCNDFDICREAVALSYMKKHAPSEISGGDYVFVVTADGRKYVDGNSQRPPKLTRSQLRYRRWLDGFSDFISFGDWLKKCKA